MKKRKLIVLVVVLVMISFTVSGCFFGTSSTTRETAQYDDRVSLDLTIQGEGRVLSLKEGENLFDKNSTVDLVARAEDGHSFDRWIGDVAEKNEVETSILMDRNKSLTVIFEKDEKDKVKGEVNFTYSRVESRTYEFTPSDPDGAAYWEWKFPETTYGWDGYTSPQKVTHQFEEYGDSLVMLRILDEDREEIGVYSKEVRVE